MAVPLTFRKNGFPYIRDGEDVLYAMAKDQNAILQFENGDQEMFGYRLNKFHQLVYLSNLFRRVHRSYLVKLCKVVNCKWLKAILANGEIIPLSRKGYKIVKKYLAMQKKQAALQDSSAS
ncbi:MAG: LytTR family transcriptional regulator DNA-binding domain-containing protein [Bacteroidetes bacterium]|nr:LytTR family transcriptional regulator DNA-binding domain-containing protein [Bacteroidota bacterium]